MSVPAQPTANDVAQAVATARRLLKANAPYSRVELVAFRALVEAFPGAPKHRIAEQIGLDADWDDSAALTTAERMTWWREDLINEVVGVLVAPLYGAQAK